MQPPLYAGGIPIKQLFVIAFKASSVILQILEGMKTGRSSTISGMGFSLPQLTRYIMKDMKSSRNLIFQTISMNIHDMVYLCIAHSLGRHEDGAFLGHEKVRFLK
jgi:hypothetical protein